MLLIYRTWQKTENFQLFELFWKQMKNNCIHSFFKLTQQSWNCCWVERVFCCGEPSISLCTAVHKPFSSFLCELQALQGVSLCLQTEIWRILMEGVICLFPIRRDRPVVTKSWKRNLCFLKITLISNVPYSLHACFRLSYFQVSSHSSLSGWETRRVYFEGKYLSVCLSQMNF